MFTADMKVLNNETWSPKTFFYSDISFSTDRDLHSLDKRIIFLDTKRAFHAVFSKSHKRGSHFCYVPFWHLTQVFDGEAKSYEGSTNGLKVLTERGEVKISTAI